MSTTEAFDYFIQEFLEPRLYSKQTISGYRWVMRSFTGCNGNKEIAQLTLEDINNWIACMSEKGNTQSTIVSNLSRFRVLVGWLYDLHECQLTKEAIYVPKMPSRLPRHVTQLDVEKMIDAAHTIRDRAIVALMFSTGIRNTELRDLKRQDVVGNKVTINQGKGLRDRITFLDDRAKELLDRYLNSRCDISYYLFVTNRGDKIANSTFRYIIKHVAEEAGVGPVHPHMFRHGIATHLMQNGMPARMIQKFLGHQNLSTTEIYLHVTSEDIANQHSKILGAKMD